MDPQLADALVKIGIAVSIAGILAVAAFLGRVPSRIAAWRKKPRLRIEARPGRELIAKGSVPISPTPLPPHAFTPISGRWASFVWIVVHNDSPYPQGDAVDATARLDFRQGVALFDYRARWRNSLQPWQTHGDTGSIIDRITIRANDKEELDVVLRWDGETDAYAFDTAAQVLPDWKRPEWRLAPGEYEVKVRVSGGNIRPKSMKFKLIVPASGDLQISR